MTYPLFNYSNNKSKGSMNQGNAGEPFNKGPFNKYVMVEGGGGQRNPWQTVTKI